MIRGVLAGVGAILGVMLLIQCLPRRTAFRDAPLPPRQPVRVEAPKPAAAPVKAERVDGEPALVLEMGRWLEVFIVDRQAGKVLVRYPGRAAEFDEWVDESLVRIPQQDEIASGTGQAYFRGTWRPCNILKRNRSWFYVHYLGESDSFDEWITTERLRVPADAGH